MLSSTQFEVKMNFAGAKFMSAAAPQVRSEPLSGRAEVAHETHEPPESRLVEAASPGYGSATFFVRGGFSG